MRLSHSVTSHYIPIQNRNIHYLQRAGQGDHAPLLILFHGFPENAHAWDALINQLPDDYHVIAPDLPGYHKSETLGDEKHYSVPALVSRMGEFVQKISGKRKAILVGHDWGGALAWPLAAFQPQLFSQLIIINAAHPSTFTQALKSSAVQRRKSEYIHQLIARDAEEQLSQSGFAMFRKILGDTLFTPDNKYGASLIADWNQPHTLTAMLNYYRQMPQAAPREKATQKQLDALRVPDIRISLPVLVLWGRLDEAFDETVLDNLPQYVEQLRIVYHNTATHWIHREQASWVAREIELFVNQKSN